MTKSCHTYEWVMSQIWRIRVAGMNCGVASLKLYLKIIGLFCKRELIKRQYSAKETYNFKEPTNRSHPIVVFHISKSHTAHIHESPHAKVIHTCAHNYTHPQSFSSARTHTLTQIHTHTHTHANAHTRIHKSTHSHAHTHTHIWRSVLQCVAVWGSVLQCVAVCCSVLQCVAVCCSVLHTQIWCYRADDWFSGVIEHSWKYAWMSHLHQGTCYICRHINIYESKYMCINMYMHVYNICMYISIYM